MKLSEAKVGDGFKIVKIDGKSGFYARLKSTGVSENAVLTVVAIAPLGSPIAIKTGQTRIAISKTVASGITVEYVV